MGRSLPSGDPTLRLPRAHGSAPLTGRLRTDPDDFRVDERLGYDPSGSGEHAFLVIRKRGRNTHDIARRIARLADVPQVAVGYAGLKDRHALTTQHFSVHLPGREDPDWSVLEDGTVEVLEVGRHGRKIRRGRLNGNRFTIRVREVRGDPGRAEAILQRIRESGVPNYFGAQRFGREGGNLRAVDALFEGRGRRPGRERRGIWLSAARSHLFNEVLATRVADGSWRTALDGDVMLLAGSQGQFAYDTTDPTLAIRVQQMQVHPSGPLCGRPSRALQPQGTAAARERAVLATWEDWIAGLQAFGLAADRRPLRLAVADMEWQWDGAGLRLGFFLAAGGYATAVLREIVDETAAQGHPNDGSAVATGVGSSVGERWR